ncbi:MULTISPECIES: sigma-70 family RNA polymerase sigma factor [Clostridium]|uniref:Sigma-70 family RNA polymerase sigma factor n=1 Tax=Clostridium frigoriphilum TaxID=443253 RepID=A0ABU7UI19_9CLOT|nr:sigma-70 family RNA polymerase sigma factor [Clostridium sp. DSM 17811]MBU3098349.1 sigma-70 family RNA polymerase sigma factor [Clostridium sp. DSM 17811]
MQEELIQQFKNGNRQAGDDYYKANLGLVYRIAIKYKNLSIDEEEILAIVNQAFAYSLKKVNLKKAKFSTYFEIVSKGLILRHFRDCERNIRTQRRDVTSKKIVYCDSLDEVLFQSETKDITKGDSIGTDDDCTSVLVCEALNKLNKRDRQAFELKLYRGLSQTQIAKLLETSQVDISRRLIRAKQRLKVILKEVS